MPQSVSLTAITVDLKLSPRQSIEQATVDQYALVFHKLPAVVVFSNNGDYILADGFHRIRAAEKLGIDTILADVKQGDRNAAWEYAALANLHHGKPLNRRERRNVVEALLILHTERSDNWIGEDAVVDDKTVSAIREDLESTSEIPKLMELVGKDGKTRPREQKGRKEEASPPIPPPFQHLQP